LAMLVLPSMASQIIISESDKGACGCRDIKKNSAPPAAWK